MNLLLLGKQHGRHRKTRPSEQLFHSSASCLTCEQFIFTDRLLIPENAPTYMKAINRYTDPIPTIKAWVTNTPSTVSSTGKIEKPSSTDSIFHGSIILVNTDFASYGMANPSVRDSVESTAFLRSMEAPLV